MNLKQTLFSLKQSLATKGLEIGLSAKEFFAQPQAVDNLMDESEISDLSSLSDDEQYFFRYDGSY